MKTPRFIRNWDENQKASAIKILGLCVAALALFVLVATVSYLTHWKQDMSFSAGEQVANAAGSLGYRTGKFLVGDFLGLGSLALIVILVVIAVRLISGKWILPIGRTLLLTLTGAFVASLLLAYAGRLAGISTAFGGGLGGACGGSLTDSLVRLVGLVPTAIFILLLVALWLFISSPKFNAWLASLWKKHEPKDPVVAPAYEKPVEIIKEEKPVKVAPIIKKTPEKPDPEAAPAKVAKEKPEDPGSLTIERDDTLDQEVQKELKPIDNRLDPPDGLPKYKFPSLELLESHNAGRHEVSTEELVRNRNRIRAALANYKIQINDVTAIVGPTVTLYKVYPAPGVKIADIKRLQEDIAMSLKAKGVRVVTLEDSVGIEVANDFASIVPLKALLNDDAFRKSKAELPVAIGYTITQKVKVFDLSDAPHLLIAGATKQGKSVGLNVIVSSLLYSKHPSELKFVFIDPKMVEFSSYAQLLHHYIAVLPDAVDEQDEQSSAIVKKPKDAEKILRSICIEMDERYELLSKAGVNKVTLYNEKYCNHHLRSDQGHRYLPYLVVVVDEYADLTMTSGGGPQHHGLHHPPCPEGPRRRYPCHTRHAASFSRRYLRPHQE